MAPPDGWSVPGAQHLFLWTTAAVGTGRSAQVSKSQQDGPEPVPAGGGSPSARRQAAAQGGRELPGCLAAGWFGPHGPPQAHTGGWRQSHTGCKGQSRPFSAWGLPTPVQVPPGRGLGLPVSWLLPASPVWQLCLEHTVPGSFTGLAPGPGYATGTTSQPGRAGWGLAPNQRTPRPPPQPPKPCCVRADSPPTSSASNEPSSHQRVRFLPKCRDEGSMAQSQKGSGGMKGGRRALGQEGVTVGAAGS